MDRKYVMITGASSGVGKDATQYLNSLGYGIVLVARNEKKLKQTLDTLEGDNYIISYDLNDLYNIESIFKQCSDNGMKLYGLVHAAGEADLIPIRVANMQDVNRSLNVNANSFLELARIFGKKKYSVDGSRIVVLSSIEAVLCEKGHAIYAGSKNLLETYAKIYAKEYIGRKICVNGIRPALVNTPMIINSKNEYKGLVGEVVRKQAFGLIDARQISYTIEFLLSEKSKYMTGTFIEISAGWHV